MAVEYKVCGTESERTGEVHTWITRDGVNLDLEDIHTDLLELQQQVEDQQAEIERLWTLLRAACDFDQRAKLLGRHVATVPGYGNGVRRVVRACEEGGG